MEELESHKQSQTPPREKACPGILKDWSSGYTWDRAFFMFIFGQLGGALGGGETVRR